MARQWQQAIQLENFRAHMPDDWVGDSKTERPFFYAVLASLAPEYVQELIKDCRQQRMEAAANRVTLPRQLNIAPEWAVALMEQPFVSHARAGNQSVLLQRQVPAQRRAPPPQRRIVPRVTMQQYNEHQAAQAQAQPRENPQPPEEQKQGQQQEDQPGDGHQNFTVLPQNPADIISSRSFNPPNPII